jgi:hypothetical protein
VCAMVTGQSGAKWVRASGDTKGLGMSGGAKLPRIVVPG